MRKPAFCICENKDTDQLCGNPEADQHLCLRYTDSTIPLLPKYEISSLLPSCVAVQPSLCQTWLETPKTGFLTTRLKQTLLSFLFSFIAKQREITNFEMGGNLLPAFENLITSLVDFVRFRVINIPIAVQIIKNIHYKHGKYETSQLNLLNILIHGETQIKNR